MPAAACTPGSRITAHTRPSRASERPFELVGAVDGAVARRLADRASIAIRRRRLQRRKQDRLEDVVKQLDAADRGGAERVAVIGVVQAEVDGVLRRLLSLGQQPILKRDLQRRFDRGRAVVRKEHVIEPGRRDLDQPPRERRHAGMRRAEQRGMREPPELFDDRRVDLPARDARGDCTRARTCRRTAGGRDRL